jgi:hypothetical protein
MRWFEFISTSIVILFANSFVGFATQSHIIRKGPNLANNPSINDIGGWHLYGDARYDASVSRTWDWMV